MAAQIKPRIHQALHRGLVVPACPLALNARRELDERRQRGLCRYYFAAGAGGLAVGVHTTQFAIREPRHGLYRPVLALVAEEFARHPAPLVRVAGVCGSTAQGVREASLVRELGYQTFDVVRAVAEAGRDDIALYTGNDDQIVLDLLTPFRIPVTGRPVERRIVGGLLGQWAVWTRRAVELLDECHALTRTEVAIPV